MGVPFFGFLSLDNAVVPTVDRVGTGTTLDQVMLVGQNSS